MKFDDKQIEYRQKHPRCSFCKYSKYNCYNHWTNCCYWECECKDKMIRFDKQAIFCKYYEIEKGDIELTDEI